MRICYVVLSPTFGIYQGLADLANQLCGKHEIHLVCARSFPADRFAPEVRVHPISNFRGTGLEPSSLRAWQLRPIADAIVRLKPDVVHFNGPHLWNVPLVRWLRQRGIPVVHTVHDLDPHQGTKLPFLIRAWNHAIVRASDRLLVHGKVYHKRLLAAGLPPAKVVYAPLLHLFVSYENQVRLESSHPKPDYEPFVLFFGRLEEYKGLDVLVEAFRKLDSGGAVESSAAVRLVVAGPGDTRHLSTRDLPCGVEVRNRLIEDEEGIDLFRRCCLLVLPYLDATQSALIPAAYFFQKPVIATRVGALPEYVNPQHTGWLVEPGSTDQLVEAMRQAASAPASLATMGQAGRRWLQAQRVIQRDCLTELYSSLGTH